MTQRQPTRWGTPDLHLRRRASDLTAINAHKGKNRIDYPPGLRWAIGITEKTKDRVACW